MAPVIREKQWLKKNKKGIAFIRKVRLLFLFGFDSKDARSPSFAAFWFSFFFVCVSLCPSHSHFQSFKKEETSASLILAALTLLSAVTPYKHSAHSFVLFFFAPLFLRLLSFFERSCCAFFRCFALKTVFQRKERFLCRASFLSLSLSFRFLLFFLFITVALILGQ